jgi:hypothetical protein
LFISLFRQYPRKWHAVMGHLAALFLFEVFDDALKEIATSTTDPEALATLLAELQAEEDADYKNFLNADVPQDLTKLLEAGDVEKVDLELFAKGPNFCHTARLPAEIRHRGILTESSQTGSCTYDKGMGAGEANTSPNNSELMRLVYTEKLRLDCPVTIHMDYQDYFYLPEREGWKKLIIPNDSELKEYGIAGQKLKGLVAMCILECPSGNTKCQPGELRREDFYDRKFKMSVNGLSVHNVTRLQECDLLENTKGMIWPLNKDGRFEITAKVFEPDSYLRVSTFIVW